MKEKKSTLLVLILIVTHSFASAQLSNVTNGFIGNTFNGGNGKWVQNYAEELDVASDGTMVTASEWDEAGRCVGIFKDGQPVTLIKENNGGGHNCWGFGTATKAVAINDNHLFVNNCDGNILRFDRAKNYWYVNKVNTGVAVGMTCSGNDLYLIKSDGVVQKRSVTSLSTVALTFTVAGGYDLAVDAEGNIWVLTINKEVLKYTASGVNTGTKIATQAGWQPSAVNYDAFNNLLLIPDNGVRRQVIKFNTSGEQVGTFGELGGISSGNKGVIGDLRFWNIAGSGTDAAGNMYVALNENAVSLRKFNPNGIKQWEVQGMMFTDIASIDPASDGKDIYGVNEHMKFDYATQQWSAVSMTCDRINNPTDPRNKVTGTDITTALMRRVNGNLIMYTASMYAGGFDVYRFDGEIAVFCKNISNVGWSGLPDKNGNIWYESGNSIKKIPLTGFSGGTPIFGSEIIIAASLPSPFNSIQRLEYDSDADVMYIGGYTAEKPTDGSWGLVGSTIARYPNWSTGNRTATNTVVLAKDVENFYPKSMSVANDYIFVGGSRDRGKLNVYKSSDLSSVGFIASPTNMGEIGWLDVPHAIQSFKKLDGKYAILVEDNSKGKNILYQWCPSGDCLDCTIVPVSSFQMNMKALTLIGSETKNMTVEILPTNACRILKWKSLDPTIVFVNTEGKISGLKPGIAKVAVTDEEGLLSDTCVVTVVDAPVTGIAFEKDSTTLIVSKTESLKANILPANALNIKFTWKSDYSSIVSIDAFGLITALKSGETAIIVSSEEGNFTDTCYVTVQASPRLPYEGLLRNIPGKIEAEDFDEGIEGIAYYDTSIKNEGNQYRLESAVDIEACNDLGGGFDVGWTDVGEWLKYYVDVEDGLYDITARVACPDGGSEFQLLLDDKIVTTFGLPKTGDWNKWSDVNNLNVSLMGGNNKTLQMLITKSGFNVNYFNFRKAIPVETFNITTDTLELLKLGSANLNLELLPTNTTRPGVTWTAANKALITVDAFGKVTAKSTVGSTFVYAISADGVHRDTCVVKVISPTGISDLSADESAVQVFPNPATNNVMIDFKSISGHENVQLKMIDVMGRIVYDSGLISHVTSLKINTNNFRNGLYYINLQIGLKNITKKLIILKD